MTFDDRGPIPPGEVETVAKRESTDGSTLVELLDRFLAEVQAGRKPDRQKLLDDHPELAAELEPCLAGIEFIQKSSAPDPEQPARLGEFVILREIGRGGMGVVYEAEQTTLKRKVALKVLRFGVVADNAAMDRFRREAETVARLHHTHIVPVFAVGSHDGVSYYAMQYIEGASLAAILDEARASETPLDLDEIARWGLEAAEALAHAHQRGIIHRDVKPSNLLLDGEGLVWLTDFGLAKRNDEATLTIHGTLMGTPRYMSPEQAEASKTSVDHRTDVYSLGATLYELATGRPVFDSSTAHGLILKILRDEPIPPRQFRPNIPRDLDTIIQKCLSKNPGDRYAKAQDLADDLRAYLEGRPIRARRATLVERVVRFVRQHKKGATTAGLAATAAALVVIGSIVGWNVYNSWLQGRLVLSTAGPPLTARLVDEQGEPTGDDFSIGTKTVVPLPAGEYRIQASAPGLFAETFRAHVEQGATLARTVRLGEDQLWTAHPIPYSPAAWAFSFDGKKSDIVASYGRTLRRFDGETGQPVWESKPPSTPSNSVFPVELGVDLAFLISDLNGDGVRELICGDGNARGFRAVSGSDGSNLWHRELGKPDADPIRLDDLDGDGLDDLLLWIHDGHANHQVEAISSRTGKAIWTGPSIPSRSYRPGLYPAVVTLDGEPTVQIVDESHWFELDAKTGRQPRKPLDLPGEPKRPPQFADLDGDGQVEMLLLSRGTRSGEAILTAYSLRRRQSLWTATVHAEFFEWTDRSGVRSEWPILVDLDPKRPGTDVVVPENGSLPPGFRFRGVRALDGRTGVPKWTCPLKRWHNADVPLEEIVAGPDLDGDGVPEVFAATLDQGKFPGVTDAQIIPDGPANVFVDALSGRDGKRLWWCREAVDGRDLRLEGLRWAVDGTPGGATLIVGLVEADQLSFMERLSPPEDSPGITIVIDVRSGKSIRSANAFRTLGLADFDGDGAEDFWGATSGGLRGFRSQPRVVWEALGPLVRGADYDGDGMDDVISADSPGDVISPVGTGSRETAIRARSGKDGTLLWESDLIRRQPAAGAPEWTGFRLVPLFEKTGDLDGDGTADLLATKFSTRTVTGQSGISVPLDAYSGKTGERLWSASIVSSSHEGSGTTRPHGADARDLDGDGMADPLVYHTSMLWDGTLPAGRFTQQARLTRVSGKDGRVVWDHVVNEQSGLGVITFDEFRHEFGDLDGDGVLDVVLLVQQYNPPAPQSFGVHAISGRDGSSLWMHPVREAKGFPAVVVGDLDGDGLAEVILADQAQEPVAEGQTIEIVALEGRTGTPRWSWLGGDQVDANRPHEIKMVLADFDGDGRKTLCVNSGVPSGRRIVRLESDGRVGQIRQAKERWWYGIHAADLDGDGKDELVFHFDGAVRLVKGDLEHDVWSWTDERDLKSVMKSRSLAQAGLVIAGDGTAIDGKTGTPVWRAPEARAYLFSEDPTRVPYVLSGELDAVASTICREATSLVDAPRQKSSFGNGIRRDPRFARPLPWEVDPLRPGHRGEILGRLVGATMLLLVLPWLILRWAMRPDPRSLKVVLAIPAVAAVVFATFRMVKSWILGPSPLTDWQLMAVEFGVAVAGLPMVLFAARLILAFWKRRWGAVAWLMALTLLFAVAIAGAWIGYDMRNKSPLEYYRWTEVPVCVGLGLYMLGALMAAWACVRVGIRGLSWMVQATWRRLATRAS